MRVFGNRARRITSWVLTYIAVGVILAFFIFPILWELLASFKPPEEVVSTDPHFIFKPTLQSWQKLFQGGIFHYFKNSLIVVGGSTVLSTFFGSMAGYALARGRMRSKNFIAMEMLTLRMLPPIAMIIPIFVLFQKMHLHNTYLGLILMYTTVNLPLSVWLMFGYFGNLPEEIGEAAMVDGCPRFRMYWQVELPLILPGLATTAIFCVIFAWNEFMFGVLLTKMETATLTVVTAREVLQRTGIDWSALASLSIFTILIPLIFALSIQKSLVKGMTLGAIK
jgi:multiple sugar transport system permease protein